MITLFIMRLKLITEYVTVCRRMATIGILSVAIEWLLVSPSADTSIYLPSFHSISTHTIISTDAGEITQRHVLLFDHLDIDPPSTRSSTSTTSSRSSTPFHLVKLFACPEVAAAGKIVAAAAPMRRRCCHAALKRRLPRPRAPVDSFSTSSLLDKPELRVVLIFKYIMTTKDTNLLSD